MPTATPTKARSASSAKPRAPAKRASQPARKAAPKQAPKKVPKTAPKKARQAATAAAAALGATKAIAGTLTHLVADAADNTLAISPLIGIQRSDVADAAKALFKVVAVSPKRATARYGHYLKELGRVIKGESELAADARDQRFGDSAWKTNLVYRRLLQAYVATQKELNEYIDGSDLDAREKGRARFFASLVTDALAPSNWLFGNPAAMRKILDTGGAHLVGGLKNLLHDIRHNNMLPSQVDATPFKLSYDSTQSIVSGLRK